MNNKQRRLGSLKQSTLGARTLLEAHGPAIMNKVVQQALAGDPSALKFCLDRIIPVPRIKPVNIMPPGRRVDPDDGLAALKARLARIEQAVAEYESDQDSD